MSKPKLTAQRLLAVLQDFPETFLTEHEDDTWLLTPYFGVRLEPGPKKAVLDLWHACNLLVEPMAVMVGVAVTRRITGAPVPEIAKLVPEGSSAGRVIASTEHRVFVENKTYDGRQIEARRREDGQWVTFDPGIVRAVAVLGYVGDSCQWRQVGEVNTPVSCWYGDTNRLTGLVMPIRYGAPLDDASFPYFAREDVPA